MPFEVAVGHVLDSELDEAAHANDCLTRKVPPHLKFFGSIREQDEFVDLAELCVDGSTAIDVGAHASAKAARASQRRVWTDSSFAVAFVTASMNVGSAASASYAASHCSTATSSVEPPAIRYMRPTKAESRIAVFTCVQSRKTQHEPRGSTEPGRRACPAYQGRSLRRYGGWRESC